MGWSFRKSTSFGPFRLNFSKSGVGVSFGVKGARISVNSRGTYVNVGANGIYYRQRINGNSTNSQNNIVPTVPSFDTVASEAIHTITTNDVENVTDVDSKAFVEELESKANKFSFYKFFGLWPSIVVSIIVLTWLNEKMLISENYKAYFEITKRSVNVRSIPSKDGIVVHHALKSDKYEVASTDSSGWVKVKYADGVGFVRADMGAISNELIDRIEVTRLEQNPWLIYVLVFLVMALIAWCIFLYKQDTKRKTLELYYTFDRDIEALHQKFLEFFKEFKSSAKIWQKLHSQGVADRKYHAGASELVRRGSLNGISLHKLPSPFLKTNVSVPCIELQNTALYFFPERIILKRGNKFGAAFYKNIQVTGQNVRFIEEETLPRDAQVIDYTWKFLNKSGGPDKRFSNNRRLPICLYSDYSFESDSGLNEVITTSKPGGMDNFIQFLDHIGSFQKRI